MIGRMRVFLDTRYNLIATLGFFAIIAIFISFIGVYSAVSYQIMRQRFEFGVRMALGATFGDILRQRFFYALRLSFAGVLFGVVASFFLTRFIGNFIFNISLTDPKVYVWTVISMTLLVLAAGTIPAIRSVKLSPAQVINRV